MVVKSTTTIGQFVRWQTLYDGVRVKAFGQSSTPGKRLQSEAKRTRRKVD